MTTIGQQSNKSLPQRRFGFFCRRYLPRAGACSAIVAVLLAPSRTASAHPSAFDLQAHRGGRGETTEASLRAFAKALELGVSTLEFDIVITSDRQPLVWHDPTIHPEKCVDTAPVLGGDPLYPYVGKPVHELTLAQIRTLDCGLRLNDFPEAEAVRGNTIATLPEVFALTDAYGADVRYNIETKVDAGQSDASAREFVDVVVAAVRSAGKVDRVEIGSFDWRTLPMVRQAEPSIPLAALWDETIAGDPTPDALSAGANILSPHFRLVDRVFVDRAHALGLRVVPWTVNDAEAMRAQIAAGVDGIITDYPARLRTVMADLGMPLPPAYHR